MRHAIVPVYGGVLSALGMLVAPRARQVSHTVTGLLGDYSAYQLEEKFHQLEQQGREALITEGVTENLITVQRSLDLRYRGQSYTLTIPWQNIDQSTHEFHQAHYTRYGHSLELPVEVVNIRIGVQGPETGMQMTPVESTATNSYVPDKTQLYNVEGDTWVYNRDHLKQGQIITGPALITEATSTSYIAPAWQCRVDVYGNLMVDRT